MTKFYTPPPPKKVKLETLEIPGECNAKKKGNVFYLNMDLNAMCYIKKALGVY